VRAQVQDHIRGLSDDDLVMYIVTGAEEYEPEAVEFAHEEFHRRDLDPSRVAILEEVANRRRDVVVAARAEAAARPLDFSDRFVTFFHGATWLGMWRVILSSEAFRIAGEDRKSSETWKFGCLGFVATIVAFVIWGLVGYFWLAHVPHP
jgi:hypothetical protein